MKITDVLSYYDDDQKKEFSFYDVIESISNSPCSETEEAMYEKLAFSLQPQPGENPWGNNYYFGPQITMSDEQGNLVYSPPFELITPKAVLYWENRYKLATNPLLKMRYASLVWDFKKPITNSSYDSDLYRTYVDSMLEVCNGDYANHPTITTLILERLFSITKNKTEDLQLAKQAYLSFEARHASDDSVRYWSSRFLMMLEHKRFFSEEEKEAIVAEHETRLVRLNTPDANGKLNPWLIETQGKLLVRYYHPLAQVDDVKRILSIIEHSFKKEVNSMSSLQYVSNLENLIQLYRHCNLNDEAIRLTIDIQKLGEKASQELTSQTFEFEIPKEVFEQADLLFGDKANSDEDRWSNFVLYFIPRREEEKTQMQELARKYPLKFSASTKLLDPKGRPSSTVGTLKADFDNNLTLHIAEKLNLSHLFLNIAINKLTESGAISTTKIMNDIIARSPIFEDNRHEIISRSLDFFFNGEHELFCHLIVPQIENAICNLVEYGGESVLRLQKSGNGFQLKTLDELLRAKFVEEVLTEDGAYYLRIVLTNQVGLNIRNLLCHGIVPPHHFNNSVANRLLHVLILLGLIRKN